MIETGTEIEPPSSDSRFPTSRVRPPVQRPAACGGQREQGHRVELGSCGPECEYVSVGGISLDGDVECESRLSTTTLLETSYICRLDWIRSEFILVRELKCSLNLIKKM